MNNFCSDLLSEILVFFPYKFLCSVGYNLSVTSKKLYVRLQTIRKNMSFWNKRMSVLYNINTYIQHISFDAIIYIETCYSDKQYGKLLNYACEENLTYVFNNIINNPLSKEELQTAASTCTKLARINMCKVLIDMRKFDINEANNELIIEAVDSNQVNMVKFLLESGADPSTPDNENRGCNTPIITACYHNYVEIAKILLDDDRVDIFDYHCIIFDELFEEEDVKLCKYLLEHPTYKLGFKGYHVYEITIPEILDIFLLNIQLDKSTIEDLLSNPRILINPDLTKIITKHFKLDF